MKKWAWVLGRVLLVGTLGAALVGCSNGDKSEAEDNLTKWQAKGPSSYVYVVQHGCFCPDTEPVRVVVTDGAVTSAINTKGVSKSDAQTMTALLQQVVQWADKDFDKFEASYDGTLGFLENLDADRDSTSSDDEFSVHVSCFAEGTSDDLCPAP